MSAYRVRSSHVFAQLTDKQYDGGMWSIFGTTNDVKKGLELISGIELAIDLWLTEAIIMNLAVNVFVQEKNEYVYNCA